MSLGLVAYDDSEESGNDSDTQGDPPLVKTESTPKAVFTNKTKEHTPKGPIFEPEHENGEQLKLATGQNSCTNISDEELEPEKSVHLHLPESKLSLINTDIDIKCLTSATKKGGTVKIKIPSLNEIMDEDEPPSKKKLKPSQKGSGLFALLPSPKSSLIPQSVTNKKPTMPTVKKPLPRANLAVKPITNKASTLINYDDSGDEEETSGAVDFFSLDSKEDSSLNNGVNIAIPEVSSTFKDKLEATSTSRELASFSEWQSPQVGGISEQPSSSYSAMPTTQTSDFGYSTSEFMTVNNTDLELDQQAMQQLCGRRDRLKMAEVNLIDVSGDAIMPDSREWLTKQLTEEVAHRPSHKRKDGPTSQQKRKHQITYLAYQAKENELELKNQWAKNRMSRKQTQAKYGF